MPSTKETCLLDDDIFETSSSAEEVLLPSTGTLPRADRLVSPKKGLVIKSRLKAPGKFKSISGQYHDFATDTKIFINVAQTSNFIDESTIPSTNIQVERDKSNSECIVFQCTISSVIFEQMISNNYTFASVINNCILAIENEFNATISPAFTIPKIECKGELQPVKVDDAALIKGKVNQERPLIEEIDTKSQPKVAQVNWQQHSINDKIYITCYYNFLPLMKDSEFLIEQKLLRQYFKWVFNGQIVNTLKIDAKTPVKVEKAFFDKTKNLFVVEIH